MRGNKSFNPFEDTKRKVLTLIVVPAPPALPPLQETSSAGQRAFRFPYRVQQGSWEDMDQSGGRFVPCHVCGSWQEWRGSDSGLSWPFVPWLSLRTDTDTRHPTHSTLPLWAQACNNLFWLCLLAAVAPVHHFSSGASVPGFMFRSQPFNSQ